ncbi:hypothetical protein SDC9_165898 [bioreactor metagenome]|uniref:Uncharacterized protein n=1 Tax=bioreactor metagenome TaxID=1076179 RepID=A0A645FVJ4_9ZZZZ
MFRTVLSSAQPEQDHDRSAKPGLLPPPDRFDHLPDLFAFADQPEQFRHAGLQAEVERMQFEAAQNFKLPVPVSRNRTAVGVKPDPGKTREGRVEPFENPGKPGKTERHHIAVGQENPPDIGVRFPGPPDLVEQFRFGPDPVRNALVHSAEPATVMRATVSRLKNQAPGLARRTVQRLRISRRHLNPRALRISS